MASTKTTKQSNAGHNNKKKASSRQNAAERVSAAGSTPRLTASMNQVNQGRFPGETPLTGEDRPTDAAGRKRHRAEKPVPQMDSSDKKRARHGQPLAARQQSSLKRKGAGSAGKGRVE